MIDFTNTTKRGKSGDSYQLIEFPGGHILLHDGGDMLVWDEAREIRVEYK